jgi:hypothetical protein
MAICTERKVKIDGIGNTSKSKPLADADKAAVLQWIQRNPHARANNFRSKIAPNGAARCDGSR